MNIPTNPQPLSSIADTFGATICPALWQSAAQLAEYVNRSYPIGMLMFWEADQSGLPSNIPDTRFWAYLDGHTVSNANSVLNGVVLPDLRGRFVRNPVTGEVAGTTHGAATLNLVHNHTGITGDTFDGNTANTAGIQVNPTPSIPPPQSHHHVVSYPSDADLSAIAITPVSHELQVYLRIA